MVHTPVSLSPRCLCPLPLAFPGVSQCTWAAASCPDESPRTDNRHPWSSSERREMSVWVSVIKCRGFETDAAGTADHSHKWSGRWRQPCRSETPARSSCHLWWASTRNCNMTRHTVDKHGQISDPNQHFTPICFLCDIKLFCWFWIKVSAKLLKCKAWKHVVIKAKDLTFLLLLVRWPSYQRWWRMIENNPAWSSLPPVTLKSKTDWIRMK